MQPLKVDRTWLNLFDPDGYATTGTVTGAACFVGNSGECRKHLQEFFCLHRPRCNVAWVVKPKCRLVAHLVGPRHTSRGSQDEPSCQSKGAAPWLPLRP